jgi:hypothetical protein
MMADHRTSPSPVAEQKTATALGDGRPTTPLVGSELELAQPIAVLPWSFFHSLKTELVMHCDYKTREEARFYNRQRRHSTIKHQRRMREPPAALWGQ